MTDRPKLSIVTPLHPDGVKPHETDEAIVLGVLERTVEAIKAGTLSPSKFLLITGQTVEKKEGWRERVEYSTFGWTHIELIGQLEVLKIAVAGDAG